MKTDYPGKQRGIVGTANYFKVLSYGLSPALQTRRQDESCYMRCYKSMKTNILTDYIMAWEKSHSFNKPTNAMSDPGLCAKNKIMSEEDVVLANQESQSTEQANEDYSNDTPDTKGSGDR